MIDRFCVKKRCRISRERSSAKQISLKYIAAMEQKSKKEEERDKNI